MDTITKGDDDTRDVCDSAVLLPAPHRNVAFADPEPRGSRLERIVEWDRAIASRPMGKLLAVLLQSCVPDSDANCEVLRPLWAEEAMHRGYNLVKLVASLARRTPLGPGDQLTVEVELTLAANLAAVYRSLMAPPDRRRVSCSPAMRELPAGLVALFGPAAGIAGLTAEIDRVMLPGFQRRALVLAASELVINVLSHAYKGNRCGRIEVRLRRVDFRHARLTVADDGLGFECDRAKVEAGVAGGLADLLAADLTYRLGSRGGTIAEITFTLESDEQRDARGLGSGRSPPARQPRASGPLSVADRSLAGWLEVV